MSYLKRFIAFVIFVSVSVVLLADVFIPVDTFRQLRQKTQKISADQVYADYNANAVQFEMEYKNAAFIITGTVARIRRGFFDEYIIELYVRDAIINVCVVYPKSISDAKKQDIAVLSKGDYFEAFVAGRSTYMYVDVICYRAPLETL